MAEALRIEHKREEGKDGREVPELFRHEPQQPTAMIRSSPRAPKCSGCMRSDDLLGF